MNPYEPTSAAPAPPLRDLGQPLVDALEAFHRQHGVYPDTLAAVGFSVVQTPHGPLEYHVSHGGRRCSLRAGSTALRPFVARWSSEVGWFEEE
jgi:hypothetical protein